MKMFKEIQSARVQYDVRVHEYDDQRKQLEATLNELKRQYDVGIEKDALGMETFTDELKIESEMDKTRAEIAKVDAKIEIVHKGKRQAMTKQIPFLRETLDYQRKEVDEEWNQAVNEVNKARAELLLSLTALGDVGRKGHKLLSEFTALVAEADADSAEARRGMTYTNYRSPESLKFDVGSYTNFNEALSVPGEIARNAYNGNVPVWVSHYMGSGEIDLNKK